MTEPSHNNLAAMVATLGGFKATISYAGRDVNISIALDGCSKESTFTFAESIVTDLSRLNERCLSLIADDSLESYNDCWRMGQIVQSDGSMVPFENPVLKRQEFCEKLALTTIEITGNQTTTFWYDCGDLFWGHSLFVTAFDGVTFEDTDVQMFG